MEKELDTMIIDSRNKSIEYFELSNRVVGLSERYDSIKEILEGIKVEMEE